MHARALCCWHSHVCRVSRNSAKPGPRRDEVHRSGAAQRRAAQSQVVRVVRGGCSAGDDDALVSLVWVQVRARTRAWPRAPAVRFLSEVQWIRCTAVQPGAAPCASRNTIQCSTANGLEGLMFILEGPKGRSRHERTGPVLGQPPLFAGTPRARATHMSRSSSSSVPRSSGNKKHWNDELNALRGGGPGGGGGVGGGSQADRSPLAPRASVDRPPTGARVALAATSQRNLEGSSAGRRAMTARGRRQRLWLTDLARGAILCPLHPTSSFSRGASSIPSPPPRPRIRLAASKGKVATQWPLLGCAP